MFIPWCYDWGRLFKKKSKKEIIEHLIVMISKFTLSRHIQWKHNNYVKYSPIAIKNYHFYTNTVDSVWFWFVSLLIFLNWSVDSHTSKYRTIISNEMWKKSPFSYKPWGISFMVSQLIAFYVHSMARMHTKHQIMKYIDILCLSLSLFFDKCW